MVRTFSWNPSMQSELGMPEVKPLNHGEVQTFDVDAAINNSRILKKQQGSSGMAIHNEITNNTNVNDESDTAALTIRDDVPHLARQQASVAAEGRLFHQLPLQLQNYASTDNPMCSFCQRTLPSIPFPYYCSCHQIFQQPHPLPQVLANGTHSSGSAGGWILRPVIIAGKLYYEPTNVGRSGDITTNDGNSHLQHPEDPVHLNAFALPQYDPAISVSQFVSPRSASQTHPCRNAKKPSSPMRSHSETRVSIYAQQKKRVETPPDDPPWVLGNPQPRSGIRGSQSWQNANAIRRKPLHSSAPFEHGSTATNLCGSLPLAAEASRRLKPTASYEPVMKSETTVSANSLNVVDPVEQHKRDLLKQIEDNKRRKEEERQRELEMERKEEARFEEYRRKLQQEIEEEERKTREKAIAAERNAARIRALQVEAETISKRSRRRDNGSQQQQHQRRCASRASSRERWGRKESYNNTAYQSRQSPVIPTIANPTRRQSRDEEQWSQYSDNVGRTASAKSRSSSRLERRRREASAVIRCGDESRLSRAHSHDSSHNDVSETRKSFRSRNSVFSENDPRDIDIGPSELEREAAASRSSTVMHRSGHFRRPPSTAKSTEDRLEWWEKKKGYADSNQQARQSPVIPALRNRMNAAGHGRQNDHDINNADDVNARAAQSHRSRSSPRYQPLASSRHARSTEPPSSKMQQQYSNRRRPQTLRSGRTSARKTSR